MTELAGQGISGFESRIVDTSSIVDRLEDCPAGALWGCVWQDIDQPEADS